MQRRLLPLAASLAFFTMTPAHAADVLPTIQHDTRYPQARRQMIAAGFQPVRILARDESRSASCGFVEPDHCEAFPEILSCTVDSACRFLFRGTDGALAVVTTFGDNYLQWCYCVTGVRLAEEYDLDGVIIAKPASRNRPQAR